MNVEHFGINCISSLSLFPWQTKPLKNWQHSTNGRGVLASQQRTYIRTNNKQTKKRILDLLCLAFANSQILISTPKTFSFVL